MINFFSVSDIIKSAEQEKKTISQIVLEQSIIDTERTKDSLIETMRYNYSVMKESVKNGINPDVRSVSGLTGGMAFKMAESIAKGTAFSGGFMGSVITKALAVAEWNACMGKIVAAPTAGSCGVLPACFVSLEEFLGVDEEKIVMGLFNASGIGMVISNNATLSGAQGGCQAECGSAAAMAASAITEILGGTPKMCGNAAAQALKSMLGLVCDPVAGLVEEPCIIRNVSAAATAVTSAEMSLAGIESIIPVDEVIHSMADVGLQMPSCLKETAEGGIAKTPTGRKIAKSLMNH